MLIKEVFEHFLSEQQSKLAPKTYRDYASVIELFEHQLEGYAWNNLAHGQQAYETAQKKGKSFIELYDHTHIAENVREFLDYFVPRKVMAGNEFISSCKFIGDDLQLCGNLLGEPQLFPLLVKFHHF